MMASSEPRPLATSADDRVGRRRQQPGAALLHLGIGLQLVVVPHAARIVVDDDARATAPSSGSPAACRPAPGSRPGQSARRHARRRRPARRRPSPGRPAPARRPATAPRTSTSRAGAGCRRPRSAGRRGGSRDRPGRRPAAGPAPRPGPSHRSARCRIPFPDRPADRRRCGHAPRSSFGNVSRAAGAAVGRSRGHPCLAFPVPAFRLFAFAAVSSGR